MPMRAAIAIVCVGTLAACGRPVPEAPVKPIAIEIPEARELDAVRVDFVLAGGRPFASAWIAGDRVVWEDRVPALERMYALYDANTNELRVVYPDSGRWGRLEPDAVQSRLALAAATVDEHDAGRPHTVRPVMREGMRAIAPCDWVVEQDDEVGLAYACIAREPVPGLSAAQNRALHGMMREAGRLGPALSPIVWPLTRLDLVHNVPLEILDADGGFHLLAQPAIPDASAHQRVELPRNYFEVDLVAEVVGI